MNFDFSKATIGGMNIGDGINAIQKATGMDIGNVTDLVKNLNTDQLTTIYEKLTDLLKSGNINMPDDFKNNLEQTVTELKNSDKSTWKDKITAFLSNATNIATLSNLGIQIMQLLGLNK